jgi:hypothetical protein
VTAPHWPFSSDSWGLDIDEAAAILAASPRRAVADWQPVTHYELDTPHGLGTVRPLGRYWYASIATFDGTTRPIGEPHRTDEEAKAAVEQAIGELAGET